VWGLRVEVWGSAFKVQGSGFIGQGPGLETIVQGLGFWGCGVRGSECGLQGLGFRGMDIRVQGQRRRFRVKGIGFRVQGLSVWRISV
jgi:hypothetical protein